MRFALFSLICRWIMDHRFLIDGLKELNIEADERILGDFDTYYQILEEKNKVMNLTAISGEEDVSKLHFLDCIALTKYADLSGKKVIDIGSGAGFPGLPLNIVAPSMKLTMLDALAKRTAFLNELTEKLSVTNAEAVHMRAEEASLDKKMRDSYDFALSRAVARLSTLCELCMPFVKVGGKFIAMKGTDSEEEINEAKNAIKILGGKIVTVEEYIIPTTDIIHRAVIIEKISPTPKGYPRRFAKIQKSPL